MAPGPVDSDQHGMAEGFAAHVRRGLRASTGFDMLFVLAVAALAAAFVAGLVYSLNHRTSLESLIRNHLARAQGLAADGDFEAAAAEYRTGLRIAPDDVQARVEFGLVTRAMGDTELALRELEAAAVRASDYAPAHFWLGIMYLEQNRLDLSIAHSAAAIRLNPGMASAYNNLGAALLRQGRTNDAAEQFRRALALDPDLAIAAVNLKSIGRDRP